MIFYRVSLITVDDAQLRELSRGGDGKKSEKSKAVKRSGLTCGRKMMNRFSPRRQNAKNRDGEDETEKNLIPNYQTSTEGKKRHNK